MAKDWITLILVFAFLLLVVARQAYSQRFSNFIMLFATDKYLLLKGKNPNLFHPFNLLLFTVNTIAVGLFIFVAFLTFSETEPARPQVLFVRIITAYAAFVLFKFSLEKILANVLAVDKKMNYYLFSKLSYRNFIAIILLPVSLSLIYIWPPGAIGIYIILGFILLMNLVSLVSIYRKNQQYILDHWFYFILYLCALEIGPYFILYKLITRL